MTEQTPMVFRQDVPMISLGLVLLGLGFVAVLLLLYLRRNPIGGAISELGWLAAPLVVFGTFAGISSIGTAPVGSSETPTPYRSYLPVPVAQPAPPLRATIQPGPPAVTPVPTDDRSKTVSASLTQRPAWVDQTPANDGISERLVLASQQYTTKEEAEAELLTNASNMLIRDLQQLRAGSRPTWKPNPEDLKRHMVKQQYAEVVERDFGNFFHPMYRVYWQVELSPEVRTEFLPEWKQGLASNRVFQLGLFATTAVLGASLVTMYRRMNVRLRDSWSIFPKILTTGIVVLWAQFFAYQMR